MTTIRPNLPLSVREACERVQALSKLADDACGLDVELCDLARRLEASGLQALSDHVSGVRRALDAAAGRLDKLADQAAIRARALAERSGVDLEEIAGGAL